MAAAAHQALESSEVSRSELRALDPTDYEDASAKHKRARIRSGTAESCQLQCERGLPKINAGADELKRWQSARVATLSGGFNPATLTSRKG